MKILNKTVACDHQREKFYFETISNGITLDLAGKILIQNENLSFEKIKKILLEKKKRKHLFLELGFFAGELNYEKLMETVTITEIDKIDEELEQTFKSTFKRLEAIKKQYGKFYSSYDGFFHAYVSIELYKFSKYCFFKEHDFYEYVDGYTLISSKESTVNKESVKEFINLPFQQNFINSENKEYNYIIAAAFEEYSGEDRVWSCRKIKKLDHFRKVAEFCINSELDFKRKRRTEIPVKIMIFRKLDKVPSLEMAAYVKTVDENLAFDNDVLNSQLESKYNIFCA